jgi:hypothetical protein
VDSYQRILDACEYSGAAGSLIWSLRPHAGAGGFKSAFATLSEYLLNTSSPSRNRARLRVSCPRSTAAASSPFRPKRRLHLKSDPSCQLLHQWPLGYSSTSTSPLPSGSLELHFEWHERAVMARISLGNFLRDLGRARMHLPERARQLCGRGAILTDSKTRLVQAQSSRSSGANVRLEQCRQCMTWRSTRSSSTRTVLIWTLLWTLA